MKVIAFRHIYNAFEQKVLEVLSNSKLEGIATNNVIIPHVKFRSLPNEHDILVFTDGRVYTLDAKELETGFYWGPSDGAWQYSPDRRDWKPITFMTHPIDIAFKKARVLESFIRQQLCKGGGMAMPQIISIIVVPDGADVSELGWNQAGMTSTGARILLSRLSNLISVIQQDSRTYLQRRPMASELATLLHIEQPDDRRVLPCYLSPHLRIDAFMGRLMRPVPRELYRGFNEQLRRPVRVEIILKFGIAVETERLFRAFRSNLLALHDLRHEAILHFYAYHDTPMAWVLVSEFFNDQSLQDLLDERCLTWHEVQTLFIPIVDALRSAHGAGIIHRYLDPSCILVQKDNLTHVRIHGFFGAVVGGYSTIGDVGSEEDNPYLAPERFDEKGHCSELQDAYSVARCIAVALTGHPLILPKPETVPAKVARALASLTLLVPDDRKTAWDSLPEILSQKS